MKCISKPVRIEPAFADRQQIRAMFEQNAPYRALATYAPDGLPDETREEARRPILPWFRGDWALAGEPLVENAHLILHNQRFLDAAKAAFSAFHVDPEFVAVNVNGPSPGGRIHLDTPSFHGATREEYPLPFLRVMGTSDLFEAWRVVRASTLSWFYNGSGGNFDYWPEGIDGRMWSEPSPFGNVALCADTDRIYHRIGPIGEGNVELPQMSAAAEIRPDGAGSWIVLENEEVRASYPSDSIRFSVLWKAEIRNSDSKPVDLTLDRIMEIFISDLRHRKVDFEVPSDPTTNTDWVLLLQRIYARQTADGDRQTEIAIH